MKQLQALAERRQITAAQFTAIGEFSDAVLMYFDWQDPATGLALINPRAMQ